MLEVRGLNFSFGTEKVLEDINLTCSSGEVIGIVGGSGTGKSTILNLISGLLQPTAGSIDFDGKSPAQLIRSQGIGYMFQEPCLLPWLNIRENVGLPLRIRDANYLSSVVRRFIYRKSRVREYSAPITKALKQSHLAGGQKYPSELSGGMRTRAAIARTIVYEPRLLLLDEPFGGLDDLVKERLYTELQEIISTINCATLLVTHDLNEATFLCDRVYVLKRRHGRSTIAQPEVIDLPRPRTESVLSDPTFHQVRSRIREGLL